MTHKHTHNPIQKITHRGQTYLAYATRRIIRRTGKARQNWARYLTGRLLGGGRLEILLAYLNPAEIRTHITHLPTGWPAAQAMWEQLIDRLGVAAALALGDGMNEQLKLT